MAIDQQILDLLRGQEELSIKDLALAIERSPAALYKPVTKLVQSGLVRKTQRLVKGKPVFYYSVPAAVEIEGCGWQDHKQVLLVGKIYSKTALDTDFWPVLKEEVLNLRQRQETLDVLIVGLKGLGKSVTGIWLADGLDPNFSVKNNVVLRKEQLLRLAVDQPENMSLLLDDLGTSLSSRGWAEGEREAIFSFFEICRQNRIDLIGTSPSLDLVDLNFRRLIRYVWDVQLKCSGLNHVHIIVHRSVSPGLKPAFRAVGTLTLSYPQSIDGLVKEYESLKRQELRGSARDALEKLEKGKEKVREYVQTHQISSITANVLMSGLHSAGLNGNLSRPDKDALQVEMYNALQEKKERQKAAKVIQIKEGKENLKRGRLLTSYRLKLQAFLDQRRSEAFSKRLAFRLTFERSKAGNLKNLPGAMGSLLKKGVKSYLVENLVLARLDDVFLVRDLRGMRDILSFFKGFDGSFCSKIFAMLLEDSKLGLAFIDQAKEMRKSFLYQYHKKFSPKKWREGVDTKLRDLEANERWKRQKERSIEGGIAAAIDIGHILFRKQNPKLLDRVDQKHKEKAFWGDV